ncbi:MAG: glycosyltransferase family 1 protein [Verrucomicrobiota bacterium JB022]|nr:glycosyltransferase family 1 protein [Verrucomicrobiota bacterium JB022]
MTETFPPEINGVSMTLSRLVGGLLRRGHQVQVIAPWRRDRRANLMPGCELISVPGMPIPRYENLRFGLPLPGIMNKHWRGNPPDLVHIATEGPLGWAASRACRGLKIPLVTSFHTNFHSYGRFYGYGGVTKAVLSYMRRFHQHAEVTFVPSDDTLNRLARAGFDHLEILGRGVDTELFSPARRSDALRAEWGAKPDTPVALYVGRVASEKNLPLTIQAWLAMRETRPDLKLVVVGDGPERGKLAQEHPEIVFAGMREGEDLASHYASGDVFLFGSVTETFGNVVTEAMASGLVLLAYDYAAPQRFVRDGENGRIAPLHDEAAYLAAARDLAAHPEAWPQMREKARETMMSVSWEAVLDKFEQRLQGILSSATVT